MPRWAGAPTSFSARGAAAAPRREKLPGAVRVLPRLLSPLRGSAVINKEVWALRGGIPGRARRPRSPRAALSVCPAGAGRGGAGPGIRTATSAGSPLAAGASSRAARLCFRRAGGNLSLLPPPRSSSAAGEAPSASPGHSRGAEFRGTGGKKCVYIFVGVSIHMCRCVSI